MPDGLDCGNQISVQTGVFASLANKSREGVKRKEGKG